MGWCDVTWATWAAAQNRNRCHIKHAVGIHTQRLNIVWFRLIKFTESNSSFQLNSIMAFFFYCWDCLLSTAAPRKNTDIINLRPLYAAWDFHIGNPLTKWTWTVNRQRHWCYDMGISLYFYSRLAGFMYSCCVHTCTSMINDCVLLRLAWFCDLSRRHPFNSIYLHVRACVPCAAHLHRNQL